eukprot:CAMPEP_0177400760 /NCGR_PEP_ID=MMETSP0368-20130122/59274_1 /TAXON_ID=447022 ORGANISM="Scrippsiella hangoei-like, Strain SHHI-4" /NCGR_SAMPLE_ID=MMETSP0368 /ASSEMBLY_ACC=CAM_ASM_000363 /LENGTH=81 /DNA_ID=CAMNT_0018868267 /DNA_START=96 /DNA_END=337 /DNA_ORIENTATION=+
MSRCLALLRMPAATAMQSARWPTSVPCHISGPAPARPPAAAVAATAPVATASAFPAPAPALPATRRCDTIAPLRKRGGVLR